MSTTPVNRISLENWNFSHFSSGELKAFVSLGAAPRGEEVEFEYCLTLTDVDGKQIFQQIFTELAPALQELNLRYQGWELVDPTAGQRNDGCSGCSAH